MHLSACTNLLEIHVSMAEYLDAIGRDPKASLDHAREAGEQCIEIDKNYYLVYEHLARTELATARYLEARGDFGGMNEALERAQDRIDQDESARPGSMPAQYYRLVTAVIRATSRLRQDKDPMSFIADGRAIMKGGRLARSAAARTASAHLYLVEAERAAKAGASADIFLENARRDAEAAIAADPGLADAELVAAEAYLEIAKTRSTGTAAQQCGKHLREALALNPRLALDRRLAEAKQLCHALPR
ncbi:MAG: hypothetical protein E6J91_07775 [Deltaproteobacteria bacterium]|nr:MAG: hypothetical protein E6J91_07775 [Deltaproteobacteria bacterium]